MALPASPEVREIPIASLAWPSLPKQEALDAVAALIKSTRASRLSKYRTCRYCKELTPPEWLHEKNVCQPCASEKLGVVY